MSYRRKLTIAGGAAVLPVFISSCEADNDRVFPNDRLWESAHFRYHSRRSDEGSCEAVLEQLERHFKLIQAYLGFSWPKDRKVDYYKFQDEADYVSNAGCPAKSDSCSFGSVVLSPHPLQDHELIHAYLAPLGLPPAFFVEGIASIFSCSSVVTLATPKSWKEVVSLPFTDRFGVYAEGPWFTGYLLYRYGAEPLLSLYERLDYEAASVDQISAAFELVYGETLDVVWNAALASGQHVRCVNLWNCSGATLPLDGSRQTVVHACDGRDNTRTFQLNTETDVVMSLYDSDYFAPVSCDQDGGYAVSGDESGVVYDTVVAPMNPGKYFIRGTTRRSVTVGVRTLAAKSYSRDCTQVEPVDLSAREFSSSYFELTIPSDGNPWFVKLHPPSSRTVWWGRLETSNDAETCLSCGEPLDCKPLEGSTATQLDVDGNVTLRFTSATPRSGYLAYGFLLL